MSDDEMSDDERRGRRERSPSPAARSKSPSKSKSPEKSPPRSPGGEPPARVTQTLEVDKDDAAFILGRGGSTKRKIARVSGTEIELDEHTLQITLNGSAEQCARAKDYIDFVRQQRVGPVTINMDTPRVAPRPPGQLPTSLTTSDFRRDDFSAYIVPGDCIGFVMGRNGQTLRSMEEEWGVLMFFAKTDDAQREGGRDGDESLCIFGPLARAPRRFPPPPRATPASSRPRAAAPRSRSCPPSSTSTRATACRPRASSGSTNACKVLPPPSVSTTSPVPLRRARRGRGPATSTTCSPRDPLRRDRRGRVLPTSAASSPPSDATGLTPRPPRTSRTEGASASRPASATSGPGRSPPAGLD